MSAGTVDVEYLRATLFTSYKSSYTRLCTNYSVYDSKDYISHCDTMHSQSLPSASSSYTTLSALSSSSSYYRGESFSSFTSIEDLQAIPYYEDWDYPTHLSVVTVSSRADSTLPFADFKPKRPLRKRLAAVWKDVQIYGGGLLQGLPLYNALVALAFCYYAWTLLLALGGFTSDTSTANDSVDATLCQILLSSHTLGNASVGSGDSSIPHASNPHMHP